MNKLYKVLNLYSGIGGNRLLWENVDVTSVEQNEKIATIYADNFPNDKIIVADAHQFLQDHFDEYDFIWSSPPCQSHSSMRQNLAVRFRGTQPIYPDMKLYEEIIFLQHNAKCLWTVENVNSYYKPLIPAKLIQRHLFWSNFDIQNLQIEKDNLRTAQIPQLQKQTGFDLTNYQISNKRQVLRNCVPPMLGNHVLQAAINQLQTKAVKEIYEQI